MFKKLFLLIIFVCFSFLLINCKTLIKTVEYRQIEKPNTDLFKSLDDLVDMNNYLVLSYTSNMIIENYTYELKMESQRSFNMMSPTGTSTSIDCLIIVEKNNEIVARIYSTDGKKKANLMANGFRGNANVKIIVLNRPSRRDLVDAYNKMMNGKI